MKKVEKFDQLPTNSPFLGGDMRLLDKNILTIGQAGNKAEAIL